MKNENTRRLHERHCGSKIKAKTGKEEKTEPGNGKLESAILELKGQFRDQVEAMSRTMQDREEQHGRELEEVRTVLRMEIDRHRKELDRLSKVEREVAAEKPAEPRAPEPQPASEPGPELPSPRMPDGRPRAIDMLPLPAPKLPKKHYAPLPESESIPDIDAEEAPAARESESPAAPPGLSREEIEAMVREIVGDVQPQSKPAADDGIVANRLDMLESRIDRTVSDLRRILSKTGEEDALKRFEKDISKISERVQDIMEDSGYGESLSVSKIPPTILEIVYQAILDDIHHEITKTKGYQDAERIARSALEEVRLKTSGSELFKFDGRKIVTDSLAKSIEANLISAKQIQTTYDVLLDKLLETVPHHKAKNFKGMIKVKSQEFAVDRATKLTKDMAKLEKLAETTNQMVAAMSANFNARNLELSEMLEETRNTTLATKADREDIDALRIKVEDSLERMMNMSTEIALLKAQLEMKESITAAEETLPAEAPEEGGAMLLAPGEMPALESEPAETSPDLNEACEKILECVRNGKDTKTAIAKESGLDAARVAEGIARLVEGKKLIEKKSGKRIKYSTLDRELEEKLGSAGEEPAGPQKKKKGRKTKAREQDDKPEEPRTGDAPAAEPEAVPEPKEEKHEEPEEEPAAEEPPEPEPKKPEEAAAEPGEEPPATGKPVKEKPAKARKKGKKAKEKKTRKGTAWVEEPQPEAIKAETGEKPPVREQAPEPIPEEPAREEPPKSLEDELPIIRKTIGELSEEEKAVLGAISPEGMTVSGIQSKVGKGMKRFALLRALRVLIDSGHVGILTKGRLELYQRINVEQMDKTENSRSKKEVK